MSEEEALEAIEDRCRSGDIEMNGLELDRIIQAFLRTRGFARLADAMDTVECWRA